MSKLYWYIIIVIFISVSGIVVYLESTSEYEVGEFLVKNGEAVLVVDFGEEKRMFIGEIIDGMTVMDSIEASANGNVFSDFVYTIDAKNKAIASIDGFSNNGKYWAAYVNGIKKDESLDKIILKVGDKIELKFE